ncbi:MAG: 7,8-didemethyl-8-hydroxy-5-deazariboflavin synthase subunit CofG, partial [Halobacteria archaeon]|nr:7,8-didemethyl-8-hydroxy-5-deazariboflavin synthase subunit CofG [Halobacteria archaeon]
PNLSVGLPRLVRSGAGDFGGVSPLTDDYINPDYEWPEVRRLREVADEVGIPLKERLPVHDSYLEQGWVPERVEEVAESL